MINERMIELRTMYVAKYGENFGRIEFVAECQRNGIDPVTGMKVPCN